MEKADILNAADIPYGLNAIIGMPGETKEMVFDTVRLIKRIKGYDGIGISIFIPYSGTELRKYAIDNNWLDSTWLSKGGLLAGSILQMPAPYLQSAEIWEMASTFKYYCFFDEKYWPAIKQAYDADALDNFEKIYNNEFYTPLASGGKTHIKLRVENHYACSSDEYVDFNQV